MWCAPLYAGCGESQEITPTVFRVWFFVVAPEDPATIARQIEGPGRMFFEFIVSCVVYVLQELVRGVKLLRSREWPIITGTVLSAECPPTIWVFCSVCTIYYAYKVRGESFGDTYNKPFFSKEAGKEYADQFIKGADLKVRVKPGDPTRSVVVE
jgi:hypothetical protein